MSSCNANAFCLRGLGYEFQIHRALRAPNNKKQYLKTANGSKDVIAEWDGIRVGAGIS